MGESLPKEIISTRSLSHLQPFSAIWTFLTLYPIFIVKMSPTVFKVKGYRFFLFSREEPRMHVHVTCPDGEAKFWIEPIVALAENYGLSRMQLNKLKKIVEERQDEIKKTWKKHFRD